MAVKCTGEDRVLTAQVSGEVDHHGAREIMGELERNIETSLPRVLELDLGGVTFMDSSGIAVLLRAYRRLGALGGEVRVHNVPPRRPCPAGGGVGQAHPLLGPGCPGAWEYRFLQLRSGPPGAAPMGGFCTYESDQ